jgi:uncharacterized protein (TIGR03435 family)
MPTLRRQIYQLLLRLHPRSFRIEFAHDMALDFEDAVSTYGLPRLFIDAVTSLVRQWWAEIASPAAGSLAEPRPSLLAGGYVMVRQTAFTPLHLGFGFIASSTQLLLCLLALNAPPRHAADVSNVSAFSSTTTAASDPGPAAASPQAEGSGSSFQTSKTAAGFTGSRSPQIIQPKPELLLFHPPGPYPAYEVATIKPLNPDAASNLVKLPPGSSLSPLSIRRYIMNAYGAVYAAQVIGGPDWLNKDGYLINGKVPDDLALKLEKMPREEYLDNIRMMQQSLLADRFHLRAHFETRILPVYELVAAKGGIKMSAVAAPPERKAGDTPAPLTHSKDSLPPGTMMSTPKGNGVWILNARAIKMPLLVRVIAGNISDRPIVDHTGFGGDFDITDLTWAQLSATSSADTADVPSLAAALREKLGLTIVPSKAPIEVLVIDSIDRPTVN